MKKLFSITLIALILVTNVKASEIPSFVASKNDKTLSVNLSFWKNDNVSVKILDQSGTILISETVDTKITKKRLYNMENLREGSYTVEVEDNHKIVKQAVNISDDVVSASVKTNNIYKPQATYNNGVWKLNYLSLGKNVVVSILDNSGNELYSQFFSHANTLHKAFDLKALQSGTYYANVSSKEGNYSFEIQK